jgi:hypothetical protein
MEELCEPSLAGEDSNESIRETDELSPPADLSRSLAGLRDQEEVQPVNVVGAAEQDSEFHAGGAAEAILVV